MKRSVLLINLLLLLASAGLSARNVSGSVRCGSERLSGVIVTDGKNFTTSDKKGKFSFSIEDDAEFVYVVTPRGYAPAFESGVPLFYLPADGGADKFEFSLVKTSDSDDYTIIAIADPQTQTMKHFEKFCGKPLADLVSQAAVSGEKGLTVGIVLGDICWDSMDILPLFKEQIKKTGIPFYPVIGNHDHTRELKGDRNASSVYRSLYGPENYAFFIGNDVVIVLDNVIYDTQKKYVEGYTEEELEWVKNLLAYIPESAGIYVAQHCPLFRWFKNNSYTERGEDMLALFEGRDVTFLTGHTHINNNFVFSEHAREFNIAALCGSWWVTDHCNDGTPSGYKVFEKKDGKLDWYYKSLGHDRYFQAEVFLPGSFIGHPNSVVANVWDYDPSWSVEWYQDGVYKGSMQQATELSPLYIGEICPLYDWNIDKVPVYKLPRPNNHYFVAQPGQYAENVTVLIRDGFGREWKYDLAMDGYVDVQAHRGGAGLMPENTVAAMKNAMDMGVNTLELDLQVSSDGEVVVSHDAYFHPRYATRPDGTAVVPGDAKEYIYSMPYSEVKKYDVGNRESTVWPGKACMPAYKPLAKELIAFVEDYAKGGSPMRYNIEIKSREGKDEGKNWPEYREFVDRCVEVLNSFELGDRLVVQCFDVRALNYMHEKYPELFLSYLTDENDTDLDASMERLGFIPEWISPHYSTVDAAFCKKAHAKGMKIVPWTVDEPSEMKRLMKLRVDAIITNYPDRLLKLTRGYSFTPEEMSNALKKTKK